MTRVALDARRLQDQPLGGVGRRLRNLLPHLTSEVEVVLLTDARRPSPAPGDVEEVRLSVPGRLPEPFWLQAGAAKWLLGFKGVFDGTYNAVPLAYRGHSVVTLHDLSWEHHPEDLHPLRRASFLIQARLSARRADVVIAVSEYARRSIMATYRLPAERVVMAPPSVDPIFSPDRVDELPALRERLGIAGSYVLALGGAKRRGLEVAVEAWRRLPSGPDRPVLVVVGREAPPSEAGIIGAGPLDDREWAALLAGAATFCYPTRYEGYGMPALEAAASGVPVVCARIGPLPEVLGDAAEWCPTPSVNDIAEGLERVIGDPGRRQSLRRAGLAVAAAAPTWADCADVVVGAYRLADR
jgi:alpha-1,3-rhamnosyl/mannosyltransferase